MCTCLNARISVGFWSPSNESLDEESRSTGCSSPEPPEASYSKAMSRTRVISAALFTLWCIYLYSMGPHWVQLMEKRRAAGGGLIEWVSYCLLDRPDNCPKWFSLPVGKGGVIRCLHSCCAFCHSLTLLLSLLPWWQPSPHPYCCCH